MVERDFAVSLRQQGSSYREIRAKVPVAKSSLSLWLRGVVLSEAQAKRLDHLKRLGGQRGGQANRGRKSERIQHIARMAEQEGTAFLQAGDVFWATATALYLAEGEKLKPWRSAARVSVTNTDPAIIKMARNWLTQYGGASPDDFIYAIYIHQNAELASALDHWARALSLDKSRIRVYFKRHNPSPRRKNVGRAYYGTMRLTVRRSYALNHRLHGWMRALVAYCGVG